MVHVIVITIHKWFDTQAVSILQEGSIKGPSCWFLLQQSLMDLLILVNYFYEGQVPVDKDIIEYFMSDKCYINVVLLNG